MINIIANNCFINNGIGSLCAAQPIFPAAQVFFDAIQAATDKPRLIGVYQDFANKTEKEFNSAKFYLKKLINDILGKGLLKKDSFIYDLLALFTLDTSTANNLQVLKDKYDTLCKNKPTLKEQEEAIKKDIEEILTRYNDSDLKTQLTNFFNIQHLNLFTMALEAESFNQTMTTTNVDACNGMTLSEIKTQLPAAMRVFYTTESSQKDTPDYTDLIKRINDYNKSINKDPLTSILVHDKKNIQGTIPFYFETLLENIELLEKINTKVMKADEKKEEEKREEEEKNKSTFQKVKDKIKKHPGKSFSILAIIASAVTATIYVVHQHLKTSKELKEKEKQQPINQKVDQNTQKAISFSNKPKAQ